MFTNTDGKIFTNSEFLYNNGSKNGIVYNSVCITLLEICYCTWNDMKKCPSYSGNITLSLAKISNCCLFKQC